METRIYKDKQEVSEAFSSYLENRIAQNESFNIALSGGSTPKVVFDHLAKHYQHIDWARVNLFWGDERCVPPNDPESNYKMTDEHLIAHVSFPSGNVHRIKGENTPSDEAKAYGEIIERTLPTKDSIPQFDLVILGMGSDGHTASIFPHEIHLWDSDKTCEVAIHPESGQKRITITGKVINNAKEVAFLVTGADKKPKVSEIFNEVKGYEKYPAALVNPKSKKLIWFMDEAAGS